MTRETKEFVVYNGHLQRVRSVRLANKPFDDLSVLRKLTSVRYLGSKMRGWFHREKRDTIVIEEDEEAICRRSMRDIICCEELMAEPVKPVPERDDRRSSITTTRTSDSDASHFSHSFLNDEFIYEPSKEQRWCLNCNKCFPRQLSHFDRYCNLDCKTAHRVRQAA